MRETYQVLIGGEVVGTALDVSLDMPWFVGVFAAEPLFGKYKDHFLRAVECFKKKDFEGRNNALNSIFSAGVILKPLSGGPEFRRVGLVPSEGEIALLRIIDDRISFRLQPSSTGSPPPPWGPKHRS